MEHGYNLNGACPCLDFQPAANTRAVFDKAGLLYRKTSDGIEIFYDQSCLDALQMFAQDSQEALSFDFKVYSTDPEFRGYTEPFPGIDGEILYFDNRAAKGSGTNFLNAADVVSTQDFKSTNADDIKALLNARDHLLPPVFVLRIFAETTKGALLQQWLDPEPTVYALRFASRQRYWKYYLLGRMVNNNGSSAGYYVDDPERKIEFESTGEETLSGRKLAYTFRSKQQIPLTENYQYRFQLKRKGQNGETVVIPSLPVASVRQVGKDTVAEQDATVSEIYINS